MVFMSFSVFDGRTNCMLSHFPHTTALEDLAGYFLNGKVAGDGILAGSGHSSLNSAFIVELCVLFWVFIPLNLDSG